MNHIDPDSRDGIFSYLTLEERQNFACTNKKTAESCKHNLKNISTFIARTYPKTMGKTDPATIEKPSSEALISVPRVTQKILATLSKTCFHANQIETEPPFLLSDLKTLINAIQCSHKEIEANIYKNFLSVFTTFSWKSLSLCEQIAQAKIILQKENPGRMINAVRTAISGEKAIPVELIQLPNLTIEDFRLILSLAAKHNQIDVIEAIIEDKRFKLLLSQTKFEIVGDFFMRAAIEGKSKIIQFVQSKFTLSRGRLDEALLETAKNGHASCFRSIISHLKTKVGKVGYGWFSAAQINELFLQAASKGSTEIVKFIQGDQTLSSFLFCQKIWEGVLAANEKGHENCATLILEKLGLKNIDNLVKIIKTSPISDQTKAVLDCFIKKNPNYLAVMIQAAAASGQKELLDHLLKKLPPEKQLTTIARGKVGNAICSWHSRIDFWPTFWINLCLAGIPLVLGFLLFVLGGWIHAVQERSLASLYHLCFWVGVLKDKYTLSLQEAIAISRENGHRECVKKLEEFLDNHPLKK